MSPSEFEAVIGLEVHCQLATERKIFCGCSTRISLEPNANSCPICVAHPGTLPVLNQKVVEYSIRAGLATHCTISSYSVFARKNYFYPDLPKGYQISQFEHPLCQHGWLDIEVGQETKRVRIERIHMEEDAGKNVHRDHCSLVNLNRAGVPLIEIVSCPDMHSSQEAGAYLRELYGIVTYLGICDGNMQEGNFRCDANVSVKLKGTDKLGTRAEIKNLNSFRFVEQAIDFEIQRQIELICAGGKVIQETRTYDSDRNITLSMRSKEESQDYRYFPDPDLVPIHVLSSWVEEIQAHLPLLPHKIKRKMGEEYQLPAHDAGILTSSKVISDFFEQVVQELKGRGMEIKTAARSSSNWIVGEVMRLINETGIEMEQSLLKPAALAELIGTVHAQTLSHSSAKEVLATLWKTGDSVQKIIEQKGLSQISDLDFIEKSVVSILEAFPKQREEYRKGAEKLLGFFVGQVMKSTGGKANPSLVSEIVKKQLAQI